VSVPTYEDFMRPVLALHADGVEHYKRDIWTRIADEMGLDQDDRNELIPSGGQRRFTNRIDWAITYMQKAGLLERTRRGYTRITARGNDVLRQHPDRLDATVLRTFPEFVAFKTARPSQGPQVGEPVLIHRDPLVEETPNERIEAAFSELNAALADDLLERVTAQSPEFFEKLVLDVLVAMGYGGKGSGAEQLGRTGDGGLDGVIRWEAVVGRPVIQAFVGALQGARATKGVLITTSSFSRDAQEYVRALPTRVVLVDGERLARLMIEHGVGISEHERYVVKRVDTDYFPADDAGL